MRRKTLANAVAVIILGLAQLAEPRSAEASDVGDEFSECKVCYASAVCPTYSTRSDGCKQECDDVIPGLCLYEFSGCIANDNGWMCREFET